jgi:hypothetical protein
VTTKTTKTSERLAEMGERPMTCSALWPRAVLLTSGLLASACSDEGGLSPWRPESDAAVEDGAVDASAADAAPAVDAGSDAAPFKGIRVQALRQPRQRANYMVSGPGASVEVFLDDTGSLRQVAFRSIDDKVRSRALFDPEDHELSRIVDEVTGSYLEFVESPERIDVYEYGADQRFRRGVMVRQNGERFERAEVLARTAFRGQLQGQLRAATAGGQVNTSSGSFAVVSDPLTTPELGPIEDVSASVRAILRATTSRTSVDPDAQTIGVKTQALLSVSEALQWAGVAIGVPAVSQNAPAYASAGVAMTMAGWFSNDVANFIESRFASEDEFSQSMVEFAAMSLRNPDSGSFGGFLMGIVDTANRFADGVRQLNPRPLADAVLERVSELGARASDAIDEARLSIPEGPPGLDVTVRGQAVWQDQTTYDVTGTVDGKGKVTLHGEAPDGDDLDVSALIDRGRQLLGRFTRLGDLDGQDVQFEGEAIGEATDFASCTAIDATGEQGTFTNAHFLGAGGGTVTFTYDAYGIPDAFVVSSSGGARFSTGGLVSGDGSAQIVVGESGFVFVSVSAPEDGTAWDYSVTCL